MCMPRTLLVTNDFPPTIGGIQSYLRDFISLLDPTEVVVFASTQDAKAAREFDSQVDYTDRKSTRLNSSHVAISYAVFCLKKKKILNDDNTVVLHIVKGRVYT